jgi:hypothetical protein
MARTTYPRFLLLWALLIYLAACATPGKIVVDPGAEPALASLRECSNAIQSARGTGKLTIAVEGRPTQRARLVWVAARPYALRLEVLGVWGQPLYKLLLKDGHFYWYDVGAGKSFHGDAEKYALKRLLGLAVEPEHLHALLTGCLPVESFRKVEWDVSEADGNAHLSLYGPWNRLVEEIELDQDPLGTKEAQFFDGWEDLQYVVTLGSFRPIDGIPFPETIVVFREGVGRLSLDVTRTYLNRPVPERVFDPETFQGQRGNEVEGPKFKTG